MQLDKQTITELSELVANAVVKTLEDKGLVGKPRANANPKTEKTAYQRTEQLLYNYRNFKRIVDERLQEIEDIKKYGLPNSSTSIVEYTPHVFSVEQMTVPGEDVENAVHSIEVSVQNTVRVITLIDKCMGALKNDPYYKILEYRYFDGRTQEDIAAEFGCSQMTVSNNKSRLVKELSMRLFPNQVVDELMN